MTSPVRVGLVGCGRLAERGYIPALAQTPTASLVAVADLDPGRCASVAPGVPAYSSLSELLTVADVELVILAHVASAHVADASLAAAAGVAALVEKPPAPTAVEAAALVELEPAAWMGFNRRFEPAISKLRTQLAVTPPATLDLELSILPSAWGALAGSDDALLDLGPHVVDLALWLAGPVVAVRIEIMSESSATFELDHGDVRSTVRVSHERAWRERIVARNGRGRTIARHDRGGLGRRIAARARPGAPSPLVGSLAGQLAAAAAAVRGDVVDERLACAADGVAVMQVLDAVRGADGPMRVAS